MINGAACLAAGAFVLVLGVASANAATVNWNLSSPVGDPGKTETFSAIVGVNTYTLGAAGFSYTGATPTNSFTRNRSVQQIFGGVRDRTWHKQ